MMELNNIPKSGTYAEGVDRHNDNYNKINLELKTLRERDGNEKGYFDTLLSLQAKYPIPLAGWQAYVADTVASTGYRVANVANGAWVVSAAEAPPINVSLNDYAKNGGSTKTMKEIEVEIVKLASNSILGLSEDVYENGYWDNNMQPVASLSFVRTKNYHSIKPDSVYKLGGSSSYVGGMTIRLCDNAGNLVSSISKPSGNSLSITFTTPSNVTQYKLSIADSPQHPISTSFPREIGAFISETVLTRTDIVQSSGFSAEKVMSQKSVTNTLEAITEGFELGEMAGNVYPSASAKALYLSLQVQDILKYDNAQVDANNSAGVIHFVQYRESGGAYNLIKSTPFLNNIADISAFIFQVGDWVGTWSDASVTTGGVKYIATGGTTRYATFDTLPATIPNASLSSAAFRFSLTLNAVSEIEKKIGSIQIDQDQNRFKKVGKIVYTNFRNSNFPSPWINTGFSATANGMKSPVTGNINQIIEYDQYSNLDSFVSSFRFNMVSLSNVLLTNYNKKLSTSGGHVVGFDFANSRITLYQATVKGTLPSTVIRTWNFGFTPVTGDTSITYRRNAMIEVFSIRNGQNSFEISYDTRSASVSTGGGYDKFGLVFLSGNLTVQEASFSSQLACDPDILVLGDSIVNGDTIRSLVGGGHENRWTGILAKKTLVSQAALGGNVSADILRDNPFYLSLFNPKKVILSYGINDTNFATTSANIKTVAEAWESKGAEVILSTLFPRDGRESFCEELSNWIKNGNRRYIDFRRCMTVNGLGAERLSAYFLADNLHPNVLGHSVMGKEAISSLEL